MRKSLLSLIAIAAIIFTASCSKDNNSIGTEGKTGTMTATFTFSQSNSARAASSNAIPVTSWANITSMNLILYSSTSNAIVYSKVINPALMTGSTNKTATWTDVPVTGTGETYTVALVANVQQGTDAVRTFFGNDQQLWTESYMYSKAIGQFRVDYPTSTQPAGSTITGKIWLGQPAEVFTAYAENVVVQKDVNTTVPTLNLKRDVSMMRVRLNRLDADSPYDNSGVDFTDTGAYIRIDKLSKGMGISSTPAVFGSGDPSFAMNAASGTDAFRDHSYSLAGYSVNSGTPVIVYDPLSPSFDNFEYWNDVIIFPNVDRQPVNTYTATPVSTDQYFIVVAGLAPVGHLLSDGNTIENNPAIVYWSGIIEEAFINNVIREVNLRLATGGTTTEPTNPPVYGGIDITVGEPMEWDSHILVSDIDL